MYLSWGGRGRVGDQVGPVFAVAAHGTDLELAGPFLLWCWSRTIIKSIRSNQRGLPCLKRMGSTHKAQLGASHM